MTDIPVNNAHLLKNSRPTIALLSGPMTSEYHEGILRGAAYVAEQRNYNIIIYCGGAISSLDPLALAREKVFDLIDMDLISGVISPFRSHMRFLDDTACHQFMSRFANVPVINVGSYMKCHTNVVTDYETGFIDIFEHFYHDHGCRQFLLVRGPKYHSSSEKRMQIYKKLLLKYDLPFDESMVLYADLDRDATRREIESYLDNTNNRFEAVITVHDDQALGVIDACKERNIRVPEDVAVVGSMNTLEGTFTSPPLTSIEEHLFELGCTSAEELISQIEGNKAQSEIHIPTSLVVRESCGCTSTTYIGKYKSDRNTKVQSFDKEDDLIFSETNAYFEHILERYKGGIVKEKGASLLAIYQQAIYKNDFEAVLSELKNRLEDALKSEDVMLWLTLTARLQLTTLRYLEMKPDSQLLVTFIAQLISLKNETEQVAIKFQLFETEYYLNHFREIVNNLNSSFDLRTIKKYTVDILQLSELYISLYNDLNADVVTATSMISVRNHESIELKGTEFIANKLVPDGIKAYQERYTLMVFPFSFRNHPIGFMTLNLSSRKGVAFENLRSIISSALKNETLIQDLKEAEERFSDIAHSTSNWLWETNVDNNFTYCSNLSTDIIGYSPEVLIDNPINKYNMNDNDSYIKTMLEHEDITDVECWYQHKNGNAICLLISAKPIISNGIFTGYRGVFDDITGKKLQEEKIKNLAYSDILTGLPNRASFQDKLAETLSFSAERDKKFAIMFIDLDHFKHINDSMGHAAGDLLLITLAERLNLSVQSCDMVARLGGDEFVIILPDIVDENEIIEVADRIFEHLKAPIMLNDKPVYSTLSLGISVYPTDGVDAQSLLQKGDNAMYQAKSQGRNGYVFYDRLLEEAHNLRNRYEDILREAIATDGFVVHYQPQVSIESGKVLGFEVLVRIQNREQGLIAPNHFIALAEELGLINHIDEWVFIAACKKYQAWKALGLGNTHLSVNLSAIQLRNDAVLDTYIQISERYEVDPADIQLEITENALIENEDIALNILQGFKNYGFSLALDDFGTGFSSLNCISLYPIDTIKIDRSFVKDAVDNPKNKAIIQGMVLIASSLNLKIIAEGVETKDQYELIKQLGCDEIQGYYFHKPYSEGIAQQLLEKESNNAKNLA